MIVVQMIGGLGNQMFQYALFRRLYNENENTWYEPFSREHNGFELDKVFNIVENPVKGIGNIQKLTRFQENTWPKFNPDILTKKDTYLCGNWQNIGYFPPEEILRNDFKFKQELDSKNKNILEEIQKTESVSIHIRRGDYTKLSHVNYFFQANWVNYYGIALNYISKNASKKPLKYFIFSDDINWCKSNIMIPAIFVENDKKDGWKDLMLMSNCKHNITTNSTFSWWAAWLNNNPDKIVTTPKRWFMDNTDSNLITLKDWVKL
jgi:hypothetical protein